MLARFRARGAVPGFRGVRAADSTVRRPRVVGPLTLRVISGIIAIHLLLGIAYVGNPIYCLFVSVATGYAAFEVRGMLRAGGYVPLDWLLIGLAALLPLVTWLGEVVPRTPDPAFLVTISVIISLTSMLLRPLS